jgi:hypothetical protein
MKTHNNPINADPAKHHAGLVIGTKLSIEDTYMKFKYIWKKSSSEFKHEKEETKIRCSFCLKEEDTVEKLITGAYSVYICNECIELCAETMKEDFVFEPVESATIQVPQTGIEVGELRRLISKYPFNTKLFIQHEA